MKKSVSSFIKLISLLLLISSLSSSAEAANISVSGVDDSCLFHTRAYNGSDIQSIISSSGNDCLVMDFNDFPAFWYGLDNNVSCEVLTITNSSETQGRTIATGDLSYITSMVQTNYMADFAQEQSSQFADTYPVLSMFGETHVPINDADACESLKLLVDSDDKYTLRPNFTLELPDGYGLTAKQIDVEDDHVWVELTKDGTVVEDSHINVTTGQATWNYETAVGDQNDILVFRLLITDVFQGQVDSLAVVEGIWLLDYENLMEIEVNDKFGKLEVNFINTSIGMSNSADIQLNPGQYINLAESIMIEVADSSELRFIFTKEMTEPGGYSIRGEIAENDFVYWDSYNFSGFVYNFNENTGGEKLFVNQMSETTIPSGSLYYDTSIVQIPYKGNFSNENGASACNNDSYPLMGLFGLSYVPLKDDSPEFITKLLVDDNSKYILPENSTLQMPNGHMLVVKSVNDSSRNVHFELFKDDSFVVDKTLNVSSGPVTWDFRTSVGSLQDVLVFRILVTDVYQENAEKKVSVEGLWLADYPDAMEIGLTDEFGEFEVYSIDSSTISMGNPYAISLSRDKTIDLAGGLGFLVADNSSLRFYPFVEKIISENSITEYPTVEDPYTLYIESCSPPSKVKSYGNEFQLFEITVNHFCSFTWFVDGAVVQENTGLTSSSYLGQPSSVGEHKVKVEISNVNGNLTNEWNWIAKEDIPHVDSLRLRSQIFSGNNISSIIEASGDILNINALDFPGFWYDLDGDLSCETLSISGYSGTRTIPEGALAYNTSIVQKNYSAGFVSDSDNILDPLGYSYPIISLFGDLYVPLSDNDASPLCKLLIDSDDRHTFRRGSVLELPYGYVLTAKQIDVEDKKVWMELSKDGKFIGDQVIDLTGGEAAWDYDVDVGYYDNIIVFRLLLTDIFQEQEESFIVTEGIWLLDYENVLEVESGDEFAELEVESVAESIVMTNMEDLTLDQGSVVDIAEGFYIDVANSSELRFNIFKEQSYPGVYEVRGSVASGNACWDAHNFAGFIYDFDSNIGGEELTVKSISENIIPESHLFYNSTIRQVGYAGTFDSDNASSFGYTYPMLGFFGQNYVPLKDNNISRIAELLIDSDEDIALDNNSKFEIADGFEIRANQTNTVDKTVHMELYSNGTLVSDKIIDLSAGPVTWDFRKNIEGVNKVLVFRAEVTDIFGDSTGDVVTIGSIWLIDFDKIVSLNVGEHFGKLEVKSISNGSIHMEKPVNLYLNAGNETSFAPGMYFKVSNSPEMRYYPYREIKVGSTSFSKVPTAYILDIYPAKCNSGDVVQFRGSGLDYDGTIVSCNWISSIDGHLSNLPSFSTSSLSNGTHTISFQVEDNDGFLSPIVLGKVIVSSVPLQKPVATIVNITPAFGEKVTFNGEGYDSDGRVVSYKWTSSINGYLSDSASFSTSDLSVGNHTINFSVKDDDDQWSDQVSTSFSVIDKRTALNMKLDSYYGGHMVDIAISGNYAYVLQSQNMVVLDISNVSNIFELSRIPTLSNGEKLVVEGEYAYVATYGSGLVIIDISNPAMPLITGNYGADTRGAKYLNDVVISENNAYISGRYGLIIVDISNPSSPYYKSSYDIGRLNVMDVSGEYAYMSTRNSELFIININNSESPELVSTYSFGGYINSICVSNNFVYAAVDNQGLSILNVSNPLNPSLDGIYGRNLYSDIIAFYDSHVYLDSWNGLHIVNVSNPTEPLLDTIYDGNIYSIDIHNNLAYMGDFYDGFIVVDVSDSCSPKTAGTYTSLGIANSVDLVGNYAYASDWSGSLLIIDVSNPEKPTIKDKFESVYEAQEVTIDGNYAYVADNCYGLKIMNISIPSVPTYVSRYNTAGYLKDVAVSGDYAYLADGTRGLVILNISDIKNPILESTYDLSSSSTDIAISGNYAYINSYDELVIFDVSNTSEPELIGNYVFPHSITDIAILGNYAYVTAYGDDAIYLIDISNPCSPKLYDSYPGSNSPYTYQAFGISIHDDYVYVAAGNDGIIVIDAHNPDLPVVSGIYETYFARDVAISNNYFYVADYTDGLVIAHMEETSKPDTTPTTSSSSGSSGGGGGSGGGTSGELYENIAFKDVKSEFVTKDSVTKYDFDGENDEVEFIQFTASRNWGKISATIEYLHDTSALVDKEPEGTVYRNLNIWVGKSGFSDSDNIKDCVIGFKVSRQWLEENDIDEGSIRLLHYSEGEWEKLDTKLTDESDEYLHFEAGTPGFSPFAIVGDSEEKSLDSDETKMSTDSVESNDAVGKETTEPVNNTPAFEIITAIAAFVLAVCCISLRKRERS